MYILLYTIYHVRAYILLNSRQWKDQNNVLQIFCLGLYIVLERLHLIWASRLHADRVGLTGTPAIGSLRNEKEKPFDKKGVYICDVS